MADNNLTEILNGDTSCGGSGGRNVGGGDGGGGGGVGGEGSEPTSEALPQECDSAFQLSSYYGPGVARSITFGLRSPPTLT
ncbi:hypothetical protein M0804_009094 [Polistes exclamans]|nr:hypothetical protein M0804_009094 [Polistes exclamans]